MEGKRLPTAVRAGLGLYGLAWRAVQPLLRRNARLREGWGERVLSAGPPPRADLWVQAASGGEAYLAWELLRRLPEFLPDRPPLRVLATTFTSQGLGVLRRAQAALAGRIEVLPAYFPFDVPGRMRRVLAAVRPAAVVLLETEIWPGLLAACRGAGTPALVLNGRMTEKSLRGYLGLARFWRSVAPERILAVGAADAERFGRVFGKERVGRMGNIKFDRLDFSGAAAQAGPPRNFAGAGAGPFVVLGSVRREEEGDVLHMIAGLRERLPQAVIGLFPRHMQRVEAWKRLLAGAGIPCVPRSGLIAAPPRLPPAVILWDTFGELAAAFAAATCCFVGGSLADLGGQNFLEPLEYGVVPVIGPSWSNFAWVGEEIFRAGLVRRVRDWRGVLEALCGLAEAPPDRAKVLAAAAAYVRPRRGGADAACRTVAERLVSV